ncbi:MAG: TatD family hydrolase, partial [Oscillospiraceae bacterium]|nr:TatD family hydrolase [Oscillospiraceae bacterium]
ARQLQLAREVDLPVVVHSREAGADTMRIMKENRAEQVGGVVHCYSGSRESCKQLVKMGLYIGFTGVITFKNARRALESLKVVPLDRLLIETDCPYMAPEPNRGKRCDSSMLHFVAQKMADELGLTKEEIIRITNENARRLFNIK